ncbi:exocyst complex component Sec10-like protein [Artemisia annua]|uniref:Exocyst complex component Sec10-like protein n=1 Tax=Artemisia annua TaxID=35608 RepID=A0A2U1MZ20_ARTAN|nr:exocyst complex component Sec10-like protein [Artemisia annua]
MQWAVLVQVVRPNTLKRCELQYAHMKPNQELESIASSIIQQAERLLTAEQKATEYRSVDDSLMVDHRRTTACTRVVAYLSRVLTAVEGLNKQSFLTELGNRLHKVLTTHWLKFSFNASGGLKLKRDINEYRDFLQNFNTPTVNEKFESLSM